MFVFVLFFSKCCLLNKECEQHIKWVCIFKYAEINSSQAVNVGTEGTFDNLIYGLQLMNSSHHLPFSHWGATKDLLSAPHNIVLTSCFQSSCFMMYFPCMFVFHFQVQMFYNVFHIPYWQGFETKSKLFISIFKWLICLTMILFSNWHLNFRFFKVSHFVFSWSLYFFACFFFFF